MTADLSKEALDALEKDLRRKVTLGTGVVTPLRIQAADAITALRAERDRYRDEAKAERMVLGALSQGAESRATAAEAEAENKKAATGERSSAMTTHAVRDSKMRTKVMREAMAIIAKIELDEMADSGGILPPDRFDEGTSAAYEAIEDAIRAAEKEAGNG